MKIRGERRSNSLNPSTSKISLNVGDMVPLDVPFYKQSMLGSCGPACVLMLLAYWLPSFKSSKWEEINAWWKAGLFPFGMTESYGLAKVASEFGLRCMVIKEDAGFKLHMPEEYVHTRIFKYAMGLMKRKYESLKQTAASKGVVHFNRPITLGLIRELVIQGIPPIVMVNQTSYARNNGFPHGVLHWIVVTGVGENIQINDPDLGAAIRMAPIIFEKALDLSVFKTDRRIVAIGGSVS